ncbi:hypothetical protein, partial [Butyrivibrio sp. WCE2006]|uniref:hypothetical protein n=1 Tax=Butyrivibrio sp. WCE2006 TaxID=1410611 RepID=UPI0012DBFBCB
MNIKGDRLLMKKKKRLLGVLLSLVLVLGLMPGMSLTAYATATEYTSLKQGDVLHVGDTINSTTEYNTGTGGWLNPNSPYTLVRADVSSSSGETHYDMVVTESATGAYYLLKGNVSGSDYYLGARITNPTNGDLQCYWPVTGTSDGISVTAVNVEQYSTEVTFAVHEVVAVTGVTLNPSTAQTINVDGKVSFTATVQPEDASEKKVKWSVVGTNSGAVKLYSDVDCKTEVGTDAVETLTVYAKGMSVGKATVKVESNADSNKSASCDVTVNEPTTADTYSVTITPSSNMTIGSNTGAATQTGLSGAMDEVVYTADDGYYFPENYSVATVNGISVTRNSYTQITVSGTPTANAAITLTAPTAKTTPAAPATAAAVDCTTADNNDGKLIGVTTAMEYKKWDDENWKVGTGSDITGLINGTYFVRLKETDTENASANQELTIAEYVAPVVTEYPLWVGGVQVTSANASNITEVSTPTASYDVTTNTLILNNANITSGYQFQDGWGKAGIYYEDKNNSNALNIVVRGANIISGDDIGIGMCGGYYYYGKLNFSGDGTLTTRGASSGIYMRNGGVQIDSGTIEASGTSSTGINAKGGITINGGNVEAMGANYGIQTMYGVKITGGTVTAQATNSTSDTGSAIYDGSSNGISITGGTVTATGISSSSKAYGLYVGSSGNIQIGSEITSLTVTGTTSASSGTVKNSVAGMGWITVDGTGDGTEIAINTSGASLSSYKKLLFPYTKSASTVKTTPNAKTLTYTGTAQELVTAGTAENGTMQYALGTDDKTEPTSGWSTSIPTGNEAKTYFVWYKAVGAAGFSDSAAACIKVTISNPYTPPVKPKPTTDTEEYTIPVENNNAVDVGAAIESGTAVINEITEEDLSKVTSNDNIGGNGNTPGSGTGDNSQIVIDLSGAKQEVVACELTKQS